MVLGRKCNAVALQNGQFGVKVHTWLFPLWSVALHEKSEKSQKVTPHNITIKDPRSVATNSRYDKFCYAVTGTAAAEAAAASSVKSEPFDAGFCM